MADDDIRRYPLALEARRGLRDFADGANDASRLALEFGNKGYNRLSAPQYLTHPFTAPTFWAPSVVRFMTGLAGQAMRPQTPIPARADGGKIKHERTPLAGIRPDEDPREFLRRPLPPPDRTAVLPPLNDLRRPWPGDPQWENAKWLPLSVRGGTVTPPEAALGMPETIRPVANVIAGWPYRDSARDYRPEEVMGLGWYTTPLVAAPWRLPPRWRGAYEDLMAERAARLPLPQGAWPLDDLMGLPPGMIGPAPKPPKKAHHE